jgi:recombination protein U
MNAGKKFEEDFKKSAEKEMAIIRLYDPAASFGGGGENTRFSHRNICDFIGYSHPFMYLFELKSHLGKSVPFDKIITKESDKRLKKMVEHGKALGVKPFVVFNWRDVGNDTFAVHAFFVLSYIENAPRKSIPYGWTEEKGIKIKSKLKRVRYTYDINDFIINQRPIKFDY